MEERICWRSIRVMLAVVLFWTTLLFLQNTFFRPLSGFNRCGFEHIWNVPLLSELIVTTTLYFKQAAMDISPTVGFSSLYIACLCTWWINIDITVSAEGVMSEWRHSGHLLLVTWWGHVTSQCCCYCYYWMLPLWSQVGSELRNIALINNNYICLIIGYIP